MSHYYNLLRYFLLFSIAVFFNYNPSLGQDLSKIDSLEKAYNDAPRDSARIIILVDLWRATIYNNTSSAKNYAHKIIQDSEELNFNVGLATGYQRLAIAYDNEHLNDSARLNYQKAILLYQSLKNVTLEASMIFNIGLTFQNESLYDSAALYINAARLLFESNGDSLRMAATLDGLAGIEIEKGNYKIAIEKALKAATIFKAVNNESRLADAELKIAQASEKTGNFTAAIQYSRSSLKYYKQHYDDEYATLALENMGDTYFSMQQYDSARHYYNVAMELAQKMQSETIQSNLNLSLGRTYFQSKDFDLALAFFEKSLNLSQNLDYNIISAAAQIHIAEIHLEKGNFDLAEDKAQQGLSLAMKTDVKENIYSAYQILSNISKAQGKYQEALDFFLLFKETKDSVYNVQKSGQIAEMQTLYETNIKEDEIVKQNAEIDLLNQKIEVEGLQKMLFALGLISMIIFSLLFYYGSKQKIKRHVAERAKEKLEYEQEISLKKKELTTHTLHLIQKNKILEEIKSKLQEIKHDFGSNKEVSRLIQIIKNDRSAEKDWNNFKIYFEQVHKDFDNKLREHFNDLTNNELRLAALMKMNLSTKEIAGILNITPESVNKARYRLRKKLAQESDQNLQNFLLAL